MFTFTLDYWIYMIPAILLVVIAQIWVSSTYRKWGKIPNQSRLSGAETAERLLRSSGLQSVSIEGVRGTLSDHYDPRSHTLRLSMGVANERSVASMAIAAHEIGHAVQHTEGYLPLRFRAALVPVVNIGSNLGWILIFVGLLLRGTLGTQLATIGVAAFALGLIFAVATLPVELNASSRAMHLLTQTGLVQGGQDQRGVRSMLSAAAFTYIAAIAAALLQLLYYASLVAGLGRRRR
ncbi:MAG TPA: zinc metallopeptidase [Anaerolineae bacterium]|nr:zinc metallopeptidase [Anaerolineae bacterium]